MLCTVSKWDGSRAVQGTRSPHRLRPPDKRSLTRGERRIATPLPAVHVVATGGSISGLGPHRLDYILYPELGQRLSIEEMLARIPEAHDIAEIQAENLIRVGSPSIGPPEWLQLAQRINQLFATDTSLP